MAMPVLWCQVEPVIRYKHSLVYLIAVISLGLYIGLAVRYPIFRSLNDPRASWATLVDPNFRNAAFHIAIYFLLTLLYLSAIYLFSPMHEPISISYNRQIMIIIVAWLACSIALMFVSPSGESHDIFDYLFRGRMMVDYHTNPLTVVPDSLDISTPFSRYIAWRYHVDTYGPLWEGFSAVVSAAVHLVTSWFGWWNKNAPACPGSMESCKLLIAYITGYRLLATCLTGLSAWLIASITKRSNPKYVPMALVAFLWCPLVLIATALGGHNDSVMLVFLLFCVWLSQRQRLLLALLTLVLAAHVKLTALIWLPVFIVWAVWRYGWKKMIKVLSVGSVIGVVLSWLLYLPLGGWQSLPRMLQERLEFLANSPWKVLNDLLVKSWGWSVDKAHQLTTQVPTFLFGILALLFLIGFFFARNKLQLKEKHFSLEGDRLLWLAMTIVSLLYVMVGSYWLQPWYFLWVIFPAVLLPTSQLTRFVLPWLGFGALASNVIIDFVAHGSSTPLNFPIKDTLPVLIIWGPALCAVGILLLINQLRKLHTTKQALRQS
jgi:hypothetical protein